MDNGFITGSQVYGTPHELSDIDLVILLPKEVIQELKKHSEKEWTLRFGKLNLLALEQDNPEHINFFDNWKTVTNQLIQNKPVTREQAIQARIDAGIGQLPKGMYED